MDYELQIQKTTEVDDRTLIFSVKKIHYITFSQVKNPLEEVTITCGSLQSRNNFMNRNIENV